MTASSNRGRSRPQGPCFVVTVATILLALEYTHHLKCFNGAACKRSERRAKAAGRNRRPQLAQGKAED